MGPPASKFSRNQSQKGRRLKEGGGALNERIDKKGVRERNAGSRSLVVSHCKEGSLKWERNKTLSKEKGGSYGRNHGHTREIRNRGNGKVLAPKTLS